MTVIYIMSSSHSGSTLLSFLLGAHPKVFSLGEFKEFESFFNPEAENSRGQFNSRCECGERVYDCPFWFKLHEKIPLHKRTANDIKLFCEIRKQVNEPVLVDNSKVAEKIQFYKDYNVPYRIIHLVRDGRARAYSEQKLGRIYKKALEKWAQRNRTIHERHAKEPGYKLIYYEDLVRFPVSTLDKILSLVNLTASSDMLNYQDKTYHAIGGNRKVRANRPDIQMDTEYLTALSRKQWEMAERRIGDTLRFFRYW